MVARYLQGFRCKVLYHDIQELMVGRDGELDAEYGREAHTTHTRTHREREREKQRNRETERERGQQRFPLTTRGGVWHMF